MKRISAIITAVFLFAVSVFFGGCSYKDCNRYTLTTPTDAKFTTNGGMSTPEVHVLIDNETAKHHPTPRNN